MKGKRGFSDSLRICLLTYRGNPTCGGQGVYIKYLSTALRDLGHKVDVFSGPPYPDLAEGIRLHKIGNLDLYNPEHLFKLKRFRDLSSDVDLFEYVSMKLGGFPEPFTFGVRTYRHLKKHKPRYDIIHDNQCLAYGLLDLPRIGYPTVATIHHPITVDREVALKSTSAFLKKIMVRRWYSFIAMQKKVARKIPKIITVSECSRKDISGDFEIPEEKFCVVPNGINMDFFYPLPGVKRLPDNIMVTNSADTPLKGLRYLLEAVASIKKKRSVKLTVIGKPKEGGVIENMVRDLSLAENVKFTGRIKSEEFAHYYAQATMAVIPSLYEGFGMPAGEAMACGVPVISTSGGALPEVVGDAGVIVPPADKKALETAIIGLLDDAEKRGRLGEAGLKRVKSMFTWQHAAQKTVDVYREAIDAHH
ncbi:MAG: glycosyltransferase family 4 protein [Smithellaceae bacterium]|nr:glycosyltransferase family 4 protein [Smithellaceae bacterium]